MQTPNIFADVPVAHTYTRAQAIADEVLFDVSETAREAGLSVPTAITAAVREQCVTWTEEDARRKPRVYQDENGRLWDVVYMAAWKARRLARSHRNGSTCDFQITVVPRPGHGHRRIRTLKLVIGPGDAGEPVATIMLPNES